MDKLLAKHGTLTLMALLVSLPFVYWIAPNTTAGTTLLVLIVILTINAIGGLIWKQKKPD